MDIVSIVFGVALCVGILIMGVAVGVIIGYFEGKKER